MKFDALYKICNEAEEMEATPDKYEVEPSPIIKSEGGAPGAEELLTYSRKLDEMVEAINGTEGESLAKLIGRLDKQGTAFEGISSDAWSELNKTAAAISELSTTIKSYINAAVSAPVAAPAPGQQPVMNRPVV